MMVGLLQQAEWLAGKPGHLGSKETAEAAAEPNRTVHQYDQFTGAGVAVMGEWKHGFFKNRNRK
jgi:hypothetical protein